MAVLDFPTSPAVDQIYPVTPVAGQAQYKWNGLAWLGIGVAGDFVLKTGDTMSGKLTMSAGGIDLANVAGNKISSAQKGHLFGTPSGGGAATQVTSADANIKLYDNTGNNWAGIGTDVAGTMWFRVGTVGGIIPLVRFEGTPNYRATINGTLNVSSGMSITGDSNFTGTITTGGTITCGSTINSNGRMTTNAESSGFFANNSPSSFFGFNGDGTIRHFYFNSSAFWEYNTATANLFWYANPYTMITFQYDSNAVTITGSAWKPGGGVWADNSDARIKNVEGDYASGLGEVAQLRPVLYTHKGNSTNEAPAHTAKDATGPVTVPYPNSPHYASATQGRKFVGLIAQDVEAVMPEMVTKRAAYIDGAAVTDLRDLDTSPLIFALINAVKELKSRVEALEGAP